MTEAGGRGKKPRHPRRVAETRAGASRDSAAWRAWLARLAPWVALAACVTLALWIQRRAPGVFFSPDDLISLEWARGLLPPQTVPFWRFLSGPAYWALALRLFGVDPVPYHVVNWLLHGLAVGLLFLLARRWGASTLTATLAAGLFAGSRLYVANLLQAVGIGEILALTFTLLAFLALDPGRPRRAVLAGLLFAAALLSKESVLLLPLVLALPLVPGASRRWRFATAGLLLAESAVFLVAFLLAGGRSTVFGGAAYATHYGANLFHNLMTYLYWMVDFRTLVPDLWGHVVPWAWQVGVFVVIGIGVLLALAWRGSVRPAAGAAWYLLALAPMLPLLNHSYLHYAYAALAGMALALAEGVSMLIAWGSRRLAAVRAGSPAGGESGRRVLQRRASWVAWTVAVALIVAHATVSEALLARRWERKVPGLDLYYDPYLRKNEYARHASESLASAPLAPHTRMVVVAPKESSRGVVLETGETVEEGGVMGPDLLGGVLDQGRALRALWPDLDSVAIVTRWTRAYRDFDIAVNSPDGYLVNLGRGSDAHLKLVSAMLDNGFPDLAVDHVARVLTEYPDDSSLPLRFARELAQGGRRPEASALAKWVIARFPGQSAAREADSLLRRLETGEPVPGP